MRDMLAFGWLESTWSSLTAQEKAIALVALGGVSAFIARGAWKTHQHVFKADHPDEMHGEHVVPVLQGSRLDRMLENSTPQGATALLCRIEKLSRDRNAPVVKVKFLGRKDELWVCRNADVNHVLMHCPEKTKVYENQSAISWGYSTMFTQYTRNERRRHRRKVIMNAFSVKTLNSFAGDLDETLSDLFCVLDQDASDGAKTDVAETMSKLTVDVISRVAFADKTWKSLRGGENSKGNMIRKDTTTILVQKAKRMMMNPWLKYIGFLDAGQIEGDKALARTKAVYKEAYELYRGDKSPADFKDDFSIMGRIISCSGDMMEMDVYCTMLTMFIAGYETTAMTLAFCLLDIAARPHVQQKIHEDLAVHGLDSPYCQNVLKESMRTTAVSDVLGRREATKDVTLPSGFQIKKGDCITTFARTAFKDPSFDRPLEFIPERWDGPQKALLGQIHFFSHGVRSCMGAQLAKMELKKFLPQIMMRYRVEPVEGGVNLTTFTHRPFNRRVRFIRRDI